MRAKHGVRTDWADEAVLDPDAVWLNPDPSSRSRESIRVIGLSAGAEAVLTVILLPAETDPVDRPDGRWWGANAWFSNPHDMSLYRDFRNR